jgi:hypothetical protein
LCLGEQRGLKARSGRQKDFQICVIFHFGCLHRKAEVCDSQN